MRHVPLTVFILACHLSMGCAPNSDFGGSSGQISQRTTNPMPSVNPSAPPNDSPLITSLTDDDQTTLKACQQKSPSLMTDVTTIDVEEVTGLALNKEAFVDGYTGSEKRILIINVSTAMANKLQLQLTSPHTIYCVNIKLEIINKLSIGIARGARLIEARQITLSNKTNTYPL